MKRFLASLLLSSVLSCSGPTNFYVNSYDGDQEGDGWMQREVLAYIGRYHTFPREGHDLIVYYNEGIKSYNTEGYGEDLQYGIQGPSVAVQENHFFSGDCIFDDSTCIIRHKNHCFILSKTLSEWQDGLYKWIAFYYKPAFFDIEGNYLFLTSEALEDNFQKELSSYGRKFDNQIRFKTFDSFFMRELDLPFRVRVKYKREGEVVLAEKSIAPESLYISGDGTICVDFSENLFERLINKYEPFFRDYLDVHREIYIVDCLIPLYL